MNVKLFVMLHCSRKSNIIDPFTVLESQLNSARFVARAIINSEGNSTREINIVETVLIMNKLSVA